jgi:hypothetical protein
VALQGSRFESFGGAPEFQYFSPETDDRGVPLTRVERYGGDRHRIRYADGTEFVCERGISRILASWPDFSTEADTLVYLFGPVLGIVLRLRGVTCLHASAIDVDGGAVAFTAGAGGGKSTTAAAFSRRGLPVLTDDVVALDDRGTHFMIPPGPRRILLWPESVAALWGAPDALELVVPGWEKRQLAPGHADFRFGDRALPLRAVYVLRDRTARDSIAIGPLGGAAGLVALIANAFGTRTLEKQSRAKEFETLSRLVQVVPLREVHRPDDRTRLGELCDAILEDVRALGDREPAYSGKRLSHRHV